ncbi:secernin-2 [Pectinophora gossypiella]|uniref:secernin-2 n=1 Tax=Pectinophora gossypiella TaxID=13191 RepID=UPI00214DFD49|nr:secernin-2 [Pectinophora gossypiella]XP_049884676.1 secernin-2 [Pectinophora gossypiella]
MAMLPPRSCDTFIVLPPLSREGAVIFGKNSDRPQNEVQEVVFYKGGLREPTKLKCTYIVIDESTEPLNSIILSKPAWMWGAEMGANDKGVVIGNEAVWTKYNDGDGDARQRRLLGMDFVRLGLERGNSAEDALNKITALLEQYGQGGPCSELDDSHFYHNSFLIADTDQAWVLETSGRLWAAEKIESGVRNISNGLTITTKIDKSSENLKENAKAMGLWDGKGEFNFTECFSSGGDETRQKEGERLLKEKCATYIPFYVRFMFDILRHKESRICRGCEDTFPTQGSQVSFLRPNTLGIHWFTGTPDPTVSLFKPFIFTPNPRVSPHLISPNEPKREHYLYKVHAKYIGKVNLDNLKHAFWEMEEESINKSTDFLEDVTSGLATIEQYDNLLEDYVSAEIRMLTKM